MAAPSPAPDEERRRRPFPYTSLKVRGGPSGNVTSVTFDGSRADLLALLAQMRLALDAVPPLAAERSPGGEAA